MKSYQFKIIIVFCYFDLLELTFFIFVYDKKNTDSIPWKPENKIWLQFSRDFLTVVHFWIQFIAMTYGRKGSDSIAFRWSRISRYATDSIVQLFIGYKMLTPVDAIWIRMTYLSLYQTNEILVYRFLNRIEWIRLRTT